VERVILDTSVLIDPVELPEDVEAAISAVSIAELHFGLLVANDATRPLRATRLGLIESRFTPLPLDDNIAREWGRLQAAVASRDANPRKRTADLAIAATANVHNATLLTRNLKDFTIIADLVRVSAL
jgi:toxin FitB